MPKKKMWVSWEDGADLTQSHKSPGDFSPLTRDGDKRLGHVVLQPIDDAEEAEEVEASEPIYIYVDSASADSEEHETSTEEMWATLLLVGVTVALQHGPEIQRIWSAFGRPAWVSVRERLAKARLWRRTTKPAPGTSDIAQVVTDENVSAALEGYRESIDSDEARERLIAALVARHFADKQIEILKNARIENRVDPDQQLATLDVVSPKELEAALRRLLEANPALLDSDPFAQIGASLQSKVIVSQPAGRRTTAGVAGHRVLRRTTT